MANKSLVEESINLLAIVNRTVRFADDTRPRGWCLNFGHGDELQAGAKDG
jgi:hypothetical protein